MASKEKNDNFIIAYSPIAEHEIELIYVYIAFTLCNESAAKAFYYKLMDTIQNLKNFPKKFRLLNEYRLVNVNKYTIIYSVDDEFKIITIVRVVYSGRDINKIAI